MTWRAFIYSQCCSARALASSQADYLCSELPLRCARCGKTGCRLRSPGRVGPKPQPATLRLERSRDRLRIAERHTCEIDIGPGFRDEAATKKDTPLAVPPAREAVQWCPLLSLAAISPYPRHRSRPAAWDAAEKALMEHHSMALIVARASLAHRAISRRNAIISAE